MTKLTHVFTTTKCENYLKQFRGHKIIFGHKITWQIFYSQESELQLMHGITWCESSSERQAEFK